MKHLLLIITGIVYLAFANKTQAQCTVQIAPAAITINCGESVDLSALGLSATPALSTNFNGGAIGAGWSTSATVLFTDPCGPSLDGTPAAWFGNVPLPRTLTTNGFDLSCGAQICFDLDFAGVQDNTNCESPDELDEGVYLQWSTTGGAPWTDLFYFEPDGTNTSTGLYSEWGTYCFTIPPGAWSATTSFQWSQPEATATTTDHWGLDNVVITPSDCNYWYDWANLPPAVDGTDQTVSPMATTTYDVVYTDGADACNASVTVTVDPLVIDATTIDNVVCPGNCTDLDATLLNAPTADGCCYNLDMFDTWGDGWNGANIMVNITGAPNLGPFTAVGSGSTVTFCVPDGLGFTLNYTGGTFENEVSYTLSDPSGTPVFNDGTNPAVGNVYNTVAACGYVPPVYNYSWTPTASLNNSNIQSPNACPTVTTTYTATLTEANNGCTATDNVTVGVSTLTASADVTICGGATTTLSATGVSACGGATSYSWSPAVGLTNANISNPVASPAATTTYTVSFVDGCGCTLTEDVIVSVGAPALPTMTTTPESCDGADDGTTTGTAVGMTPGYTYSWSTTPIQTTQTATGLAPGNYTVTITDAGNCSASNNITVIAGPIITAGIDPEVNQCLTGNSFGFTNNGTTGVTYAWDFGDAGPGTSTAEDPTYAYPAAGTFTVTQTVTSGACSAQASIDVTVNPMPIPTLIQDSVDCFGGETGIATVELPVTDGTAPYTYSWTSAPVQTTNPATGLAAGNYTVTVTDANLCPGTANITVFQPPALAPTAVKVDPSCNGFTDGTATATGVNGTAGYSYSWNTAPIQNTQTATGLAAGTYTCTVTDFHGCSETVNVTLIDPAGMTLTPTMNPANCGLPDGDATVNVAGGVGPFTYLWDDISAQTTQTASTIGAATYTVVVTDQGTAGCTADTTITVTTTAGITAFATLIRDALCTDSLDGMAYATPVGGAPVYTYAWNDGAGVISTDSVLTAGAGTYTLVITDGSGCTGDTTIVIGEPTQIVASIPASNDPSCFGASNGDATATGIGGTVAGAYTYSWNTAPVQITQNATGLAAGTYIVTVSDDNLCMDTASITLIDGPQMTSTVVGDSVNCFGGNDGSANLTVNGGTGFTFIWPVSGSAAEDPTGLDAGEHYVIINSAEGCTLNDTIMIFEPTQLITVLDSSFDASCNGFSDGTAFTTTTGGTGTYSYSWTTAPAQTADDASFLAFGLYTLTVTDNNNCQTTTIANIGQPAPLDAIFGSFDAYCALDQGTAWISPTNGTAPYIYAWDSAGITPLGTTTSDTIYNLYPGNYNVQIDDANGCKFNTIVAVNPAPGGTANISASTDVSCFAGADGTATVSTAAAFPGFTYLWDDLNNQTTNPATGLTQGNYNVIVTDTFGCIMNANIIINQPTALNLGINAIPQSCPSSCDGQGSPVIAGGTAPYTFLWDNNANNQISQIASNLCEGTYSLTVTDSLGCSITDSVYIGQPDSITVTTGFIAANCNQADGSAWIQINSGATGGFNYSWATNPVQTTDTATNITAGTYNISFVDGGGCVISRNVTIPDLSGPIITIDSVYNVECFGGNDGYAEIQVSGGITPYTYLWDDATAQTTPSASNLAANPAGYTVTVTDSNGCTASENIVITEPTDIVLSAGGTDPSCFSFTDGSVWVNAIGGTTNGGDYTYTWNDPAATANDTVYNLASGTYTAIVADSNNCFKTIDVTLDNPLLFTVSVTGNNVTCTDVCNGDATAT
ncbi:PKD domain-containing protein [Vicingaceae bacterium]|nr:PKD domain-containing protein [Vicingaceae bacterium]